jgi:hypothetical protein
MTIQKAHWDTEGDNVRLSMPFSKVDQERRIVSGFATLDNIDKQSDIVTTDASLKAFAKFRGNIREMHQPTAVGKMVSFKEDKYFDPESKKFYTGVYVSAYVSKGAQDTWEKVLDGTLSGFSIGGRMNKWDDAYDEKADAPVRIIKEYDLVELSLVDNPANQFANVLSIEKVDGVDVVTGIDANTELENVFWDADSGLVLVSENEVEVNPVSGQPMKNIGFVEKSDTEKVDLIKFLVDDAKGITTIKMNKEVSTMTDETTNVEETVEVAPEADAVVEAAIEVEAVNEVVETVVADEIEKADEADSAKSKKSYNEEKEDDEEDDEDEEEDMKPVSKSDEVAVDTVAELNNTLTSAFSDMAAVIKSLSDQVAELKKSVGFVSAQVADAESDFNNLGKRVDAVEADTAFRKSGDLGEIVQEPAMVEKSVWGGRFLTNADLLK